jgi:hypothetical protein
MTGVTADCGEGSRVSGGGPTSCGGGALRKPLDVSLRRLELRDVRQQQLADAVDLDLNCFFLVYLFV